MIAEGTPLSRFALVSIGRSKTWCEVIDGEYYNFVGGHHPRSAITVHEEVEAQTTDDLDWTKTDLLKEGVESGWLSPEGRFYGCFSTDHDNVARYILKQNVDELEKTWVRVYGQDILPFVFQGTNITYITLRDSLTAEQRNWLSEHGHHIDDIEAIPEDLVAPEGALCDPDEDDQ